LGRSAAFPKEFLECVEHDGLVVFLEAWARAACVPYVRLPFVT
jgi:hypothetical protein